MRERRDTEGFLYGTVLERGVTSLFLASEREGEIQSERMESGRRVREGGRECEGEIKEVWFSSTQLLTATSVPPSNLLLLFLCSLLLFLPFFLPSWLHVKLV